MPVLSAGHPFRPAGPALRLPSFCKQMALIELFASGFFATWCGLTLVQILTCDAGLWTLLSVLAVAKTIRLGIATAAVRMSQHLEQPVRQWQAVIVLAVSGAVLPAQMSAMATICWRLFQGCPAAAAASDTSAMGVADVCFLMVTALTDLVLSFLWSQSVNVPPRPPKPQVTSFVVRDVELECRDSVCVICLDELTPGCLAGRLPCDHVFHDQCCRTWLEVGHRQARCPMLCPFVLSSPNGHGPSVVGSPTTVRTIDLESNERPLELVHPATDEALPSRCAEVQSTSHAAIPVAEAV